jgi:hypothetical protein
MLWGQGDRRARRLRAVRDNPNPTASSVAASPAGTHTEAPVDASPRPEDADELALPGGGVDGAGREVDDGSGGGGFSILDDDTAPQKIPFAVKV